MITNFSALQVELNGVAVDPPLIFYAESRRIRRALPSEPYTTGRRRRKDAEIRVRIGSQASPPGIHIRSGQSRRNLLLLRRVSIM